MRKSIILFCFCFFWVYRLTIAQNDTIQPEKATIVIVKIDSTPDYYKIYGVSEKPNKYNRIDGYYEGKYEIVSRKVANDCKNITINSQLAVTLLNTQAFFSSKLRNIQPCDVSDMIWGRTNFIPYEAEWDCALYIVDEIFGLCYTTDSVTQQNYKAWIKENPVINPFEEKRRKLIQQIRNGKFVSKKKRRYFHVHDDFFD